MLDFSRRSLGAIVRDVFVDRGGAPAQFLVEHVTLSWPGGVEGLRLPSLFFFLLSLPVAAAVGRRLLGETAGLLLPPLLALAPLAVELATFGRMYALFLLCVLGATWLGIRRGREREPSRLGSGGRRCGAARLRTPDRAALRAARAPDRPRRAPAAVARAPQLVRELRPRSSPGRSRRCRTRTRSRCSARATHVGEAARLRTTAGRSIPEESLHALTPGGTAGALLCALLAVAGLVWLARDRRPAAIALGAWLVVPVAFFALVPAETRFFGRYLIPALPMLLLLVLTGCFAVVRLVRAPRRRCDRARRRPGGARGPRGRRAGSAPFASCGCRSWPQRCRRTTCSSPRPARRARTRPPELLDDYVALERPVGVQVEELPAIDPRYERGLVAKGRRRVVAFLDGGGAPRRAVWVFRGRPRRVDAALRRLGGYDTVRASPELALVRSSRPAEPRELVREALAVRKASGLTTPADRWPRLLVEVDRASLASP